MGAPKTALMTVTGAERPPSLAEAAGELGLTVDALNPEFGVVPIDPARRLFAVEVWADRLAVPGSPVAGDDARGRDATGDDYRGPYANPEIAPFGLGPRRKPDTSGER
ncbi:MAG: hypothetical protein HZA68_10495 [Rhodovulum sp.]|nr:hypothetical protein [Rhodovulum sp.]